MANLFPSCHGNEARNGQNPPRIMEMATGNHGNILVVDDESDLAASMGYALRAQGYSVQVAETGEGALKALSTFDADVVLLDLMLPDIPGMEVCRIIRREKGKDRPIIIIVSAKGLESDRIVGFEGGADDYVTKPFSIRELILRVDVRLRGLKAGAEMTMVAPTVEHARTEQKRWKLGNLLLDESSHQAFVDGKEISISALEMRLLIFLFRAPGGMRSRKDLLTEVWGYHPDVASRTVDTHIKRIRDKMGSAAHLLQTIRGVGFRLAEPPKGGARDG